MNPLGLPWEPVRAERSSLGAADMRLAEETGGTENDAGAVLLARGERSLRLYPYPRSGSDALPPSISSLPARPRTGVEPRTDSELEAARALGRMHEVLARIEELEAALDDPEHVWDRLGEAWRRAEDEADPRMAEIVRQARAMPRRLLTLEMRIRRVLRRTRERVPIDRVQEMDRASMLWFVRQPGRNSAERAGPEQRVLAVARQENFDTLENRVLRAYAQLARFVARRWLREHLQAKSHTRARAVEGFSRTCHRLDRELADLGVGVAYPGATPNYVLMEDRDYREVREAWMRLLRQESLEDDLWAWQAQAWTDFCVLATTLTLHQTEGAEFVAQSPIVWLDEARGGRRFLHDRPLAVFHLQRERLVVEVQARPVGLSEMQYRARAWVWLRIFDLQDEEFPRRVPIWTPHMFKRLDFGEAASEAVHFMAQVSTLGRNEVMREGIVLAPAHGISEEAEALERGFRVRAVAIDGAGPVLGAGMAALANFLRALVGAPA